VLARLGEGLSNAQIAARLYLSEARVKGYVSRMLDELGCANRAQAGLLAHDAPVSSARSPGRRSCRLELGLGARQAGPRPSPGPSCPPVAAVLTGPPRVGGCCDHVVDAVGDELLQDQRMHGSSWVRRTAAGCRAGRSQLPRHYPALGSFGRSVMHTSRRRETGRPRAAQFGPRAVYIPGGGTTWCGRKARRMVTADLLSRARARARARVGDGEAFRELTESHRLELQVHCYRMLGSFADAEDAVQDTMLTAWQAIGRFAAGR
jgi:Sigma-70 region 2/Bacterial regulatory proteins, luxR family